MGTKSYLPKFRKEDLLRGMGETLKESYIQTKTVICTMNESFLPYLQSLGFTKLEEILPILLSNDIVNTTRRAYRERLENGLESGEIELLDVLTPQTIERIEGAGKTEYPKLLTQELNKVSALRLRRAEFKYLSSIDPFSTSSLSRPLELFKESIILSPSGFALDVPKFIEIYTQKEDERYIREQSERHKTTAEALNRFFSNTKITRKELLRYFSIVNDKIVPNPNFSTKEAYLKLRDKGRKMDTHKGNREELQKGCYQDNNRIPNDK